MPAIVCSDIVVEIQTRCVLQLDGVADLESSDKQSGMAFAGAVIMRTVVNNTVFYTSKKSLGNSTTTLLPPRLSVRGLSGFVVPPG